MGCLVMERFVCESQLTNMMMLVLVQVLRVINESPSPSLARKSTSLRRSQPPSFLNTDDTGETFLQVQ